MALYIYYIYFLAIHIIILAYYIFTLLSNQSKHRIISLKKADGIRVIEKFQKELKVEFETDILNPKLTDIHSYKLFNTKLILNSKYANMSYLDNVSLIAVSYLGGVNNWIKNEIYIKNYLVVSYYLIFLFSLLFILTGSFMLGIINVLIMVIFTSIIIIDLLLRSLHIKLTIECLSELELIDKYTEETNVIKTLNVWKVKNLEVYYRIISDLLDFFVKKKKETSP